MILKLIDGINAGCDCSSGCVRTMQTTGSTSCALSKVFGTDVYTIGYCEKQGLSPVVRNSKGEKVFKGNQKDLIVKMKAA